MEYHRTAAALDDVGDGNLTAQEGAKQIKLDGAPELLLRRLGDGAILRRRATGIVVQNIEPAVAGDGGLDVASLGDIATFEVAITARIGRQRSGDCAAA